MDNELKPCPFCGGKAGARVEFPDALTIGCLDVSCPAYRVIEDCSRDFAIAAWNRRPEPPRREAEVDAEVYRQKCAAKDAELARLRGVEAKAWREVAHFIGQLEAAATKIPRRHVIALASLVKLESERLAALPSPAEAGENACACSPKGPYCGGPRPEAGEKVRGYCVCPGAPRWKNGMTVGTCETCHRNLWLPGTSSSSNRRDWAKLNALVDQLRAEVDVWQRLYAEARDGWINAEKSPPRPAAPSDAKAGERLCRCGRPDYPGIIHRTDAGCIADPTWKR
jgi:hypothetical protein